MNLYPTGTILGAVLGSQAQGFATADSDTDRGCVFLAPYDDHALSGYREPTQSIQQHDPDIWGHELGKFCRLAVNGNPTILELLFTTTHDLVTHSGQLLLDNRDAFLSIKRVTAAYQGYATSQVARALKDDTIKPRRHALRLLWQCSVLVRSGVLPVYTPKIVREAILSASKSDGQFTDMAENLKRLVEEHAPDSPLPDYPDEERIETIIRAIRRSAR